MRFNSNLRDYQATTADDRKEKKEENSPRKKDVPNYQSLIERINNAGKNNCIIKAICPIGKSIIRKHC